MLGQELGLGHICPALAFLSDCRNGHSTAIGRNAIASDGQCGQSRVNIASGFTANRSGMTTEEDTAGC